MKYFTCSITGCLLMFGALYTPLHAQTIQHENLPQERRNPLPLPPPEEENDSTKAYEGKIYQCKDDGTFVESATASVNADEVFSGKDVSSRARITDKPEPAYALAARQHHITGSVRLKMVLAANGKVADIKIAKGLSYGLTENSIRAVCRMQFEPAIKDGHTVSQSVMIVHHFNVY